MKIKHKKYKGSIYSKLYTIKINKNKFKLNIFEDDSGDLVGYIGNSIKYCREDATLEYWIDDISKLKDFYNELYNFLQNVKISEKLSRQVNNN